MASLSASRGREKVPESRMQQGDGVQWGVFIWEYKVFLCLSNRVEAGLPLLAHGPEPFNISVLPVKLRRVVLGSCFSCFFWMYSETEGNHQFFLVFYGCGRRGCKCTALQAVWKRKSWLCLEGWEVQQEIRVILSETKLREGEKKVYGIQKADSPFFFLLV